MFSVRRCRGQTGRDLFCPQEQQLSSGAAVSAPIRLRGTEAEAAPAGGHKKLQTIELVLATRFTKWMETLTVEDGARNHIKRHVLTASVQASGKMREARRNLVDEMM
ncbi:hypothetical protein WMY93_015758 [Mugilogobius chulae]|uniref:Uncharacterized protein n=1 Tax=Mugilogobius chulae TaxID=88201 RepID=A0AAW0P200_9GOBI